MQDNSLLKTKESYTEPKAKQYNIVSSGAVLDISNPGGTVDPLDPTEG